MAFGAGAAGCGLLGASHAATGERTRFEAVVPGPFSVNDEKPTSYASVTEYGNFYEFGPDKDSRVLIGYFDSVARISLIGRARSMFTHSPPSSSWLGSGR